MHMETVYRADIHSPAIVEILGIAHWGHHSLHHCHTYLQTCGQILTIPSPLALESPEKIHPTI